MNIFVGNLACTATDQDLRQLFESYGTVDTINVMTDRETGATRAALGSWTYRSAVRPERLLQDSTGQTSLAGPARSTKPTGGRETVSQAEPAGKQRTAPLRARH